MSELFVSYRFQKNPTTLSQTGEGYKVYTNMHAPQNSEEVLALEQLVASSLGNGATVVLVNWIELEGRS